MITPEQSAALKDYFPVKSHEFLNGNTYITEEAITNRLDEIDPSWQFKKLEIRREGNVVTAVYCLMVCGVERDGVGMASVQYGKDKDGKPSDREVNEAEKSAATDALKRCARLFGIGRYILEMGKSVSDYRSLEQWLIQRSNVTPLNSIQDAPISIAAGQNVELPATPKNGARTPQQALKGNGPDERTIAPNNDAWDEPAIKAFVAHYKGRVDINELLAIFKIKRFGEWKNGGIAAYKVIDSALSIRNMEF